MGITKDIRKKIEGHRAMIAEHEAKIEEERKKPHPDERLIRLWEKQIANARAQIEKLERRLRRRRKRG